MKFSDGIPERSIKGEQVKECDRPLTKQGKCIKCGADIIIHISKYNGHKHFHCDKCGCSVME